MKKLFYLSLSLLCLSLSALIGFHIGSTASHADTPGNQIAGFVIWSDEAHVILENGDMYRNSVIPRSRPILVGNYWSDGAPSPKDPSPSRDD